MAPLVLLRNWRASDVLVLERPSPHDRQKRVLVASNIVLATGVVALSCL